MVDGETPSQRVDRVSQKVTFLKKSLHADYVNNMNRINGKQNHIWNQVENCVGHNSTKFHIEQLDDYHTLIKELVGKWELIMNSIKAPFVGNGILFPPEQQNNLFQVCNGISQQLMVQPDDFLPNISRIKKKIVELQNEILSKAPEDIANQINEFGRLKNMLESIKIIENEF
ncbi:hypothetical protein O9G_000936 [Rozella allomycis CSF55]|uniref:Uncharacterized protein n=1 Tax=Rozella allomycis (strain CSF55) TaxID=988480 RepID=A0A075ARD9_ROZAC|nr:hypothetical protein O9G_000936 [Rozella allomycis CSF55]|eukprot:EPZ31291.1 hypothetical protein O9G_000936 [Rozella allomycis CSF55]